MANTYSSGIGLAVSHHLLLGDKHLLKGCGGQRNTCYLLNLLRSSWAGMGAGPSWQPRRPAVMLLCPEHEAFKTWIKLDCARLHTHEPALGL